jgi:eukaryotic-like serine/threonine-protein kinase
MRPSSMVTSSQRFVTPLPVGTAVVQGTLRARLEEVRAQGTHLNLRQAVGIVVPLCVQIAELHRNGLKLFVHPSSLLEDQYGFYKVSLELAHRPPILPRDKACLAPEERGGEPGSARASVFAVGAILYELVTGLSVGPGMRRPSEVVSSLPQAFEGVLAKALVSDPAHRPDDLNALAQALHQFAPPGSVPPPPPADVSRLDHDSNFEVDVRMSMLPPEDLPIELRTSAVPRIPPGRAQARPMDATSELASLKSRLESDPRPRYVVVKEGMDHGPFSAVELLQQIANHTFVEGDVLRDSLSADERPIKDWEEFAPFAEHAKLHRDIKAEKVAIERVVAQEGRSTRGKAFFGILIVGALLAGGVFWFLTRHGSRSDEVAVQDDTLSNIEVDGGLSGSGKRGAGGKRIVGKGPGGIPILGGGMSCEAAQNAYVEEMNVGGPRGQADITAGQYGAILNRGAYFGHCGVPHSTSLKICAAVQNGRAVGVSVTASPRNPGIERCVAGGVRGLSFPSHPKLDVTRTTF